MFIAYDNSAQGISSGAYLSFNHTIGAGAYPLLLFFLGVPGGSGSRPAVEQFAGVTMTHIAQFTEDYVDWHVYALPNPPTGTNSFIFGPVSVSPYNTLFGLSGSYSGCDPSIDCYGNTQQLDVSPVFVSTTVIAENCWLVTGGLSLVTGSGAPIQNLTTSGSRRQDFITFSNQVGCQLADSNGTVVTGTQGLNVFGNNGGSFSNDYINGGITVSIKPFGTSTNALFFAGN